MHTHPWSLCAKNAPVVTPGSNNAKALGVLSVTPGDAPGHLINAH